MCSECTLGIFLQGWGGRCGFLLKPAGFSACSDSATVDTDGTVSVGETAVLPYRPEISLCCSAPVGVAHASELDRCLTRGTPVVTLGGLRAAQVGKGRALQPDGALLLLTSILSPVRNLSDPRNSVDTEIRGGCPQGSSVISTISRSHQPEKRSLTDSARCTHFSPRPEGEYVPENQGWAWV